jgi:hypothetical protein
MNKMLEGGYIYQFIDGNIHVNAANRTFIIID